MQYRRPLTGLPAWADAIISRLCARHRIPGTFDFNRNRDGLYKLNGLVTLVEADSEGGAVAIRQRTHPRLFNEYLVGIDVLTVESPEAWSEVPDSTFIYHPSYIVAVREGPGAHRSFEVPDWVYRRAVCFW